jgi:hypothetical protein
LQDAKQFSILIFQRDGEEGFGAVFGLLVEGFCAGEIETVRFVGIGNIDALAGQCGERSHIGAVLAAIFVPQADRVEGDGSSALYLPSPVSATCFAE